MRMPERSRELGPLSYVLLKQRHDCYANFKADGKMGGEICSKVSSTGIG